MKTWLPLLLIGLFLLPLPAIAGDTCTFPHAKGCTTLADVELLRNYWNDLGGLNNQELQTLLQTCQSQIDTHTAAQSTYQTCRARNPLVTALSFAATASCPEFATPIGNDCYCKKGYEVSVAGTGCVLHTAKCTLEDPHSYYESSTGKCTCDTWYIRKNGVCVPQNTIESCQKTLGPLAWANETTNKCTCQAEAALVGSSCVEMDVACKSWCNPTSYWNPVSKQCFWAGGGVCTNGQQPPSVAPTKSAPPGYIFTKRIALGARGTDVERLQGILIQKGFLPPTTKKGYFGTLTRDALKKYQKNSGLTQSGRLDDATLFILNR